MKKQEITLKNTKAEILEALNEALEREKDLQKVKYEPEKEEKQRKQEKAIEETRENVEQKIFSDELNSKFENLEIAIKAEEEKLKELYGIEKELSNLVVVVNAGKDYNLYENNFSNVLALIAFTGYGSYLKSTFRSSPEFTTNGMLAKCWRRINGEVYLFKSGTEGFANSGNEPFSEYYASQIGLSMGIDIIPYNLAKWKGKLCSYSKLFTSLDYSFIPIGRIIKDCNMDKVINYYKTLGPIFYDSLIDMIVFDAIILNTDRHFGNFGLLIDNKTNKIVKPAPLFDHGL